ncbi:hypothetical protein D9M71_538520 [compost metagenome]
MGKVQFYPLEAGITRTAGGIDEVLLDPGDIVQRHFAWHFRQVRAKGNGRRGNGLPAARVVGGNVVVTLPRAVGAGLAPGVGDLDTRHGTGSLDGLHHRYERLSVGIAPDTGATGGDAPFRCHRSGFNHQQAGTATGQAGQVHVVPVVDHAVLGHVLAHRRNGDAVAQGDVLEAVRFEQGGHGQAPGLFDYDSSIIIELWQLMIAPLS